MTKSALTEKFNPSSSSSAKASCPAEQRSSRFELIKPKESGNLIQAADTIETEEFLREVVDACASCVAVLDESGAILYTSRAWRLFEQSVDAKAQPSDIFARCRRVDDVAFSDDARTASLRDNVQCLL